MSIASLPDRPNLAQLRRQAKDLRNAVKSGDRAALGRLARHVPGGDPAKLATAQLAIAREHGFSSWPAMRAEVMARTTGLAERVDRFLYESIAGHGDRPVRMLRETRRSRRTTSALRSCSVRRSPSVACLPTTLAWPHALIARLGGRPCWVPACRAGPASIGAEPLGSATSLHCCWTRVQTRTRQWAAGRDGPTTAPRCSARLDAGATRS